jgi:hypothetical protein
MCHMSHQAFTTAKELAKLTDLSTRQIQRMAAAGKVPGCVPSSDGYHRTFPITDDLRKWIADEAVKSRRRRKYLEEPRMPVKRTVNEVMEATTKAHKLRLHLREMMDRTPLDKWDIATRRAIKLDLEAIVEMWKKL